MSTLNNRRESTAPLITKSVRARTKNVKRSGVLGLALGGCAG